MPKDNAILSILSSRPQMISTHFDFTFLAMTGNSKTQSGSHFVNNLTVLAE